MLASIKSIFKRTSKSSDTRKNQTSLMMAAFVGILEDVLFWRKMWLSLSFILFINILFFLCVQWQINFVEFVLGLFITILCIDSFEAWLKHKHRTTCLKRLASYEGHKVNSAAIQLKRWVEIKCYEFLQLRQVNHTKAFLLMNIHLGIIFFTGKYVNGYLLMYLIFMTLCLYYKVIFPLLNLLSNARQDLESDGELESLIPEISEVDIKLLSIEPEIAQITDEKQCYDYWKPEDVPLAECSDSSDNSSSLVTNFSMGKMHSLEQDVESTDTSEDEYIPLDKHKERLQSTLEVIEPGCSWSSAAYNTLWNFSGAVTSLIQTHAEGSTRKRLTSKDSSDGFEIIDQNDLS